MWSQSPADCASARSLLQQYIQGGNIGIPLDQGRHRAETLQRIAIQVPHGFSHAAPVIVDHDVTMRIVHLAVPRQVQLTYTVRR